MPGKEVLNQEYSFTMPDRESSISGRWRKRDPMFERQFGEKSEGRLSLNSSSSDFGGGVNATKRSPLGSKDENVNRVSFFPTIFLDWGDEGPLHKDLKTTLKAGMPIHTVDRWKSSRTINQDGMHRNSESLLTVNQQGRSSHPSKQSKGIRKRQISLEKSGPEPVRTQRDNMALHRAGGGNVHIRSCAVRRYYISIHNPDASENSTGASNVDQKLYTRVRSETCGSVRSSRATPPTKKKGS